AVVVIVGPGSRDGIRGMEESGLPGHIRERPVLVVPQERRPHGMLQPRPPDYEDVHKAVVVVIRLYAIEASELVLKSCRRRLVLEFTLAIVMEVRHGPRRIESGRDDV